jgi:hypothetical protein
LGFHGLFLDVLEFASLVESLLVIRHDLVDALFVVLALGFETLKTLILFVEFRFRSILAA